MKPFCVSSSRIYTPTRLGSFRTWAACVLAALLASALAQPPEGFTRALRVADKPWPLQFPHLEATGDGQHYFFSGEFADPNWVFAALLDRHGRSVWSLYVEVPGFDLDANISSWFELDADNRPILYRFFLDTNQRAIVKLDPDRDFSPVYAFVMEAGGWGEQRFFRTANGLYYITQSGATTQIARWDLNGNYTAGSEVGSTASGPRGLSRKPFGSSGVGDFIAGQVALGVDPHSPLRTFVDIRVHAFGPVDGRVTIMLWAEHDDDGLPTSLGYSSLKVPAGQDPRAFGEALVKAVVDGIEHGVPRVSILPHEIRVRMAGYSRVQGPTGLKLMAQLLSVTPTASMLRSPAAPSLSLERVSWLQTGDFQGEASGMRTRKHMVLTGSVPTGGAQARDVGLATVSLDSGQIEQAVQIHFDATDDLTFNTAREDGIGVFRVDSNNAAFTSETLHWLSLDIDTLTLNAVVRQDWPSQNRLENLLSQSYPISLHGSNDAGTALLWSSLDDQLLTPCDWTRAEVEAADYTVQTIDTSGWTFTDLAITTVAEPPTIPVTQTNLSDRLRPYTGFTEAWERLYWQTSGTCGGDLPDIIPPRLTITPGASQLRLSWLAYPEFIYELQSAASLSPPRSWTSVLTIQDADGPQSQSVPRSEAGPLYYRLKVRTQN